MGFLGKLSLFLTALASFFIATWAFSLYSNPLMEMDKQGKFKEIEEGREKIGHWFKVPNNEKFSPIEVAFNRYNDSRGKIIDLEGHVKETVDFYKKELEILQTTADSKNPAKQVKLVNGQPVEPKSKMLRMVPLEMEDVRDMDGKVLVSLKAQEKEIEVLRKTISEKQKELEKIAKESESLVVLQTGEKGLQIGIEKEKIKRKLVGEEFEAIQDKLISLGVETDDLFKRRKELEKRLVELSSGSLSLP